MGISHFKGKWNQYIILTFSFCLGNLVKETMKCNVSCIYVYFFSIDLSWIPWCFDCCCTKYNII